MLILLENLTDFDIQTKALEDIAKILTDRGIELIICDDDFIRDINLKHRRKNDATDVLSFPLQGEYIHMPLGSIIISINKAIEASNTFGHSQENELSLLFIHGLLHLLGYDHETDDGEMREKERFIIEQFDLPLSLIIRTEELD